MEASPGGVSCELQHKAGTGGTSGAPSTAQGAEAMVKAPVSPLQVETPEEAAPGTDAPSESQPDRVYLDLTPVKSFLHSPSSAQARAQSPPPPHPDPPAEAFPADPGPAPDEPLVEFPESPELQVRLSPSREAGLTFAAPGPAKPCLLSPKADTAAGESRA